MPYTTVSGTQERASRVGHADAVMRALADQATFHVPAEHLSDLAWLEDRILPRSHFAVPSDADRLTAALAIDGSSAAEQVRDGLPSVVYGYAQAAAAYVDLEALETQRAARFVDPVAIERAVNTALVSLDLPVAGAFTREGVDVGTSWRESLDRLFRLKKVEVNRLDQSLLELLLLVHGVPGVPAATVPVNCPADVCDRKDVAVPAAGCGCPGCGEHLYPSDMLRIHEESSRTAPTHPHCRG